MMALVINPKTQEHLTALSAELPQSVLLTGEKGVGLATIARELAGRNMAAFIEPENAKGQIDHETGTITVETIRGLYEQTRSKQIDRQVIIIDDADRMSHGAQGAFLKLLEEPTKSAHFVLTSHAPQLLLPTIRSRVQPTFIEHATADQTQSFITGLGITDARKRTQLDFLAHGLPAELYRLAGDDAYFAARAEIMTDARDFLTAPMYGKLRVVQKYHQDRAAALQLLDSCMAITRRSLSQKPQPALVQRLERLLTIYDRISSNHSIRLQLADFVL